MQQAAAKLLVPSKLLVIYYQIPPLNPRVLGGREWALLIYYNYIIIIYGRSHY
jgi:hypothetical protein